MPENDEDFVRTILEALSKKYDTSVLKTALEQLESSGLIETRLQELSKPRGSGIISREKVERAWNVLPDKAGFAMTAREVASMAKLPLSVTQRALYILLTEGRAERIIRDNSRVKKPGKPTYEYYKLPFKSLEAQEKQKVFDMRQLRMVIPKRKAEAMSVGDIADAMNGSPITIRQKLSQLKAAGEVGVVSGFNKANQPITKFYIKRKRS